MYQPNFTILYVNNPETSSEFYEKVLGKKPIASHPAFVVFSLGQDILLALWIKHGVMPQAMPPGGSELAFYLHSSHDVDNAFNRMKDLGAQTLQSPESMDFGYTFTSLDPDGHRLRFFTHAEGWEWLNPETCRQRTHKDEQRCAVITAE